MGSLRRSWLAGFSSSISMDSSSITTVGALVWVVEGDALLRLVRFLPRRCESCWEAMLEHAATSCALSEPAASVPFNADIAVVSFQIRSISGTGISGGGNEAKSSGSLSMK